MYTYAEKQKQVSKNIIQKKETERPVSTLNLTGIPDRMKSKFENLSGFSFDDVRVHYNSDKPAQLQALAYTKRNHVYVAPGQEKHLEHELGHVVQQKQGRVIPTGSIGGVAVNDDARLEREADVIGNMPDASLQFYSNTHSYSQTIQCAWTVEGVNRYLTRDQKGMDAVYNLNSQGYTVIKYDNLIKKRTFTDGKKPKAQTLITNGWHKREIREIAINNLTRNDPKASSTLVHEVAHANQHEANEMSLTDYPYPDVFSKEVDAHIKQEEYNRVVGIPSKHNTFKTMDGKIDTEAIIKYVKNVYNVGPDERPSKITIIHEPQILERIKPWTFPEEEEEEEKEKIESVRKSRKESKHDRKKQHTLKMMEADRFDN